MRLFSSFVDRLPSGGFSQFSRSSFSSFAAAAMAAFWASVEDLLPEASKYGPELPFCIVVHPRRFSEPEALQGPPSTSQRLSEPAACSLLG